MGGIFVVSTQETANEDRLVNPKYGGVVCGTFMETVLTQPKEWQTGYRVNSENGKCFLCVRACVRVCVNGTAVEVL